MLLNSPQTTFVDHLAEVVFDCDAMGNPEPVITWYRDGLEIAGATKKKLTIAEVDLPDRAVYYCTAHNSQGSVMSEEAFLNIRGQTSRDQDKNEWKFFTNILNCSGLGLTQYFVAVSTSEEELSAVDEWVRNTCNRDNLMFDISRLFSFKLAIYGPERANLVWTIL